ncbi:hypothetical protein J4G02_11340 [Candidatus Poribacteria bacterium]|nr:hypothetical protein [Candidatus Poribacteria bacterium]
MTKASEWRIALAQRIMPVYANHPKVKVVIVGGSVGRGIADCYSDVEIGVFWTEPPSEAERKTLAERVGAVYREQMSPYEFDPRQPGEEEADEDIYVGGDKDSGFNVDIKHKTIAAVEQYLVEMFDHCQPHDNRLAEVLSHSIPLYGQSLAEQWRRKVAIYPTELAQKIVHTLLRFEQWWLCEQFAKEEEMILVQEQFSDRLTTVISVLAVLNRVYLLEIKWTDWSIEQLKISPSNLIHRAKQIFGQPSQVAAQQLRQLIEETFDLVKLHLPGIGVESRRQKAFKRTPKWVIRSKVDLTNLESWQHELLQKVKQAYVSNPNVKAMMLSGLASQRRISGLTSRQYASGDYGDLEFTVFWADAPSETERGQAIQAVRGTLNSIEPFAPKQEGGRDNYSVSGVNVDVQHVTIGQITSILTSVLNQFDPSMSKQAVIATLVHGIPLHNENLIQQWQKKSALYPDELIQSTVNQILSDFKWAWSNRVEIYAHRDGSLFFRGLFTYQTQEMLKILMSLNRVYVPKYGNRLNPLIEALEIAPPNFGS